MTIYQFMADHPFMTFFLALVAMVVAILLTIEGMVQRLFVVLPNRILRHWNINKHGYPPEHCDADGDFKVKEEE